jgi:uncharacterized membrane protein YhaH (DUF805 family)
VTYYLDVLKKYADFSGRARRAEYWMFTLINFVISAVLFGVDNLLGTGSGDSVGVIGGIYSLAVLLPSLAVTCRRLHDTDRSGWWMLIAIIPIIGAIVLIIFLVQDSTPGTNRYGPNPKETPAADTAA